MLRYRHKIYVCSHNSALNFTGGFAFDYSQSRGTPSVNVRVDLEVIYSEAGLHLFRVLVTSS
jgi:hypothetical protein